MTGTSPGGNGTIYPSSCLRASPAYWKWVKLTAADVHALRVERGFEVVGCQFVGRYVLVTLDDCSGETIELKLEAASSPHQSVGGWSVASAVTGQTSHQAEPESAASLSAASMIARPPARIATKAKDIVLATTCEDKHCHAFHVLVDGVTLDVGMTIVVGGSLELFRGIFQVKVVKMRMVRNTEEELRIWRDYATFYQQVLARPWVLSAAKVEELEEKGREQERIKREENAKAAEKKRQREEKRAAKRLCWSDRVKRDEQRHEQQREEAEARLNGNALDKRRKPAAPLPQ